MEHPGTADPAPWRTRLGRVGVWVAGEALDPDPGQVATLVEGLGYGALWIGGGNAQEAAFSRIGEVLSASRDLVVATGIVNIWAWEPAALAEHAVRLGAGYPGRFVLGLGVSHAPLVQQLGRRYEQPYEAMVAYLDALDAAGAGGPPRVLAALGPRMLRLAGARAAGAHPYLTTPEHTRTARETLGPLALLAPEQALVVEDDAEIARRIGRTYLARYLLLPNYAANLRRLGWRSEALDGAGSDALVDALVPHGGVHDVADAVRAHLDAGADHVCVQPLGAGGSIDLRALEALAPALTGD